MSRLRLRVALAAVLTGCLAFGCKLAKSDKDKGSTEVEAISVEAANPERRTMAETVEVSGNLEPLEKAEVYAQQSGIVKEVFVREGDKVSKGQVLAKIDDNEISLSYRQAQSSYDLLKDKFARYQELYKEKMVSDQEFKELEKSFHDAGSNRELYALRLNNTELRAPISGEVIAKSCEPHQFMGGMEKAFTVADVSKYKVNIFVTESALKKLKGSQEVQIRIDALDADTVGYTHRGAIDMIAPQVDPGTGTAKVLVVIPDPPAGAKPGMFARLRIITALKTDVLAIKKRALVREEPAEVWVVKGSKVELRQFKAGLQDEDYLEVVQGINGDEPVVIAGMEALSDKSKVKVVSGSGALPKPGKPGPLNEGPKPK
jgi:membrane fusion protein, multidrug efflux system